MSDQPTFDVVVPTVGRPSLTRLLDALERSVGPRPGQVLIVDDRRLPSETLPVPPWARILPGRAAGPAAARNAGWRAAIAEWVAFLDDDVVPERDWLEELASDLASAAADVAGIQGDLHVPLPTSRRPTDWERNVAGLAHARWATADMAYRRSVLADVSGFDERFPRAYREDADLAVRVQAAGHRLAVGGRRAAHPVGPSSFWTSARVQRGNADDARMRSVYGRRWRQKADAPSGRLSRHVSVTTAGLVAAVLVAARRWRGAAAAGALWTAGTAELATRRIAPGPRTSAEVVRMIATSVVIPAAAVWHRLRGEVAVRVGRATHAARPAAVLFDRDGTLVRDVPYNGDPASVELMPGAGEALGRLRAAGVRVAVVSNQSGVARGMLTPEQVDTVNRRVEELLGPIGVWAVCHHRPEDGCACRKPAPGLVFKAALALGVPPERCAVVGDIGSDVGAARAAGARGVLVPTSETRPEEIAAADEVAGDLGAAIDLLLGWRS